MEVRCNIIFPSIPCLTAAGERYSLVVCMVVVCCKRSCTNPCLIAVEDEWSRRMHGGGLL